MITTHEALIREIIAIDSEILDVKFEGVVREELGKVKFLPPPGLLVEVLKRRAWIQYCGCN
jgi:hypothetical protein